VTPHLPKIRQLLETGDREHYEQALELLRVVGDAATFDALLKGVKWSSHDTHRTVGTRGQKWVNAFGWDRGGDTVMPVLRFATGLKASKLRAKVRSVVWAELPEQTFRFIESIVWLGAERLTGTYDRLLSLNVPQHVADVDAPLLRAVSTKARTWAECMESLRWALSFPRMERVDVVWSGQPHTPGPHSPIRELRLWPEFMATLREFDASRPVRVRVGQGYWSITWEGHWLATGEHEALLAQEKEDLRAAEVRVRRLEALNKPRWRGAPWVDQ